MLVGRAEHIHNGCEAFYSATEGALKAKKMTHAALAKQLAMTAKSLNNKLESGDLKYKQVLAIQHILGFDIDPQKRILNQNAEMLKKLDMLLEGREPCART